MHKGMEEEKNICLGLMVVRKGRVPGKSPGQIKCMYRACFCSPETDHDPMPSYPPFDPLMNTSSSLTSVYLMCMAFKRNCLGQ